MLPRLFSNSWAQVIRDLSVLVIQVTGATGACHTQQQS
jgi:hypothetical protein